MTKRKGLNLNDLTLISEDAVPERSKRTPYRELLKRIPVGKALVLTDSDLNLLTVSSAVRNLQKKGEFTDYIVSRRKIEGKLKLFIIHPSEKQKST